MVFKYIYIYNILSSPRPRELPCVRLGVETEREKKETRSGREQIIYFFFLVDDRELPLRFNVRPFFLFSLSFHVISARLLNNSRKKKKRVAVKVNARAHAAAQFLDPNTLFSPSPVWHMTPLLLSTPFDPVLSRDIPLVLRVYKKTSELQLRCN